MLLSREDLYRANTKKNASVRIAIIDPSGFTLPYDHCLAATLSQHGCKVVLIVSQMPPGVWDRVVTYERWEHFYQIASKLTKSKLRTYLKGCEHPLDMIKLVRRLRRWKPDIIHFQWIPLPIVDEFFLQQFQKIAPLVLTVHDTEPFHGTPSSQLQLVRLTSVLRSFDHYIVHTQHSKEAIVHQLALSEHQVTVIPHGIFAYYQDLLKGDVSNKGPACTNRKKTVLFFGVLKPYKGVDVLLKAFARLPKSIANDVVLQVVGYPKMPIQPLQTLARDCDIEDRIFWDLRFVEESEVALYFAKADVVVLPYRRIDQSGVLAIALAFGKPIIASRVGGFSEILKDGVHGILVEPGDVESLTHALAHILEDDELRARMSCAVQELAEGELSWDNVAKRTIEIYQLVSKLRKPSL
jgi:glycosyltransferase involved in cell wall biosynthesis